MEHTTDNPPLTSVQQCVADALAAGYTLTDTAETYGVHRVTIYRWMKTSKPFAAALHRARAEFVLARRDDLHHLSNRALETLLAVLDNPKASPAVQLRAAISFCSARRNAGHSRIRNFRSPTAPGIAAPMQPNATRFAQFRIHQTPAV